MTDRLRRASPLLAFAGLCYLPLLATARDFVVADTKSYLYIDPDRLLARAWSMWDPHVGLGTVTHQNIGFLWPMGPYYWLMEHAGVPDWAAQRLWLGSILFAAGLGVRFLLRTFGWRGPGVAVAMCAYALTPYLLTIAVRISAILLPFVALPWMIALTVRAIRTGSWRHPAVFALVVATVGTSNATSIVLAGVGPLLWVLWVVATRERPPLQVAAAVARIGTLTLATNAWWIVGLSVQATNGVDVLQYTESVETTAAASSAQEVLRGLGYWFFYGDDPLGPWVGPSRPFQSSTWLLLVTFAVPVVALAGGALARWRERSFFVLLAVVGLTLAVGVYPYRDPPLFGRALKAFLHSDVGMAMRSMPRAAPIVVLALAVMLGAGVHAVGSRRPRLSAPAAAVAISLVVLSLPPLWQRTLVPDNLRHPEQLPQYWLDAGTHLDATDDGTRVLEVPGADFTSYRWGTTVDPVTPGVTDRPLVARELVPMGSAAAWNLLKAFDGRLQARIGEPSTVAPIARLMRAGQLLVRSDLQYEHYDTPRPTDFWSFLMGAPDLGPPRPFGAPTANIAEEPVPMLDELALTLDPGLPDPPPVAVLPVAGVRPIVAAQPTAAPVVLAGDGEGIVDSAAAGVIDGTELIRYSASLTRRDLADALDQGAVLVVTDSNRRRGERWGTIRFTNGYTEPPGLEPLVVDRTDARLPVFPDAGDEARTVALHRGGITANATSYGGRNEYLPEDRPAHAVDGDPTTAWRTSRDDPVVGQRLELRTAAPVTTSTLTFLAPPPPINRWVTRVALRFDGGPPVVVDLDERSHQAPGQVVDVGSHTFRRLSIEVVADTAGSHERYGGWSSTGFAEVRVGELRLDEMIRPPVELLRRSGPASARHPLAIVLTRLRSAPTDVERLDEEPALLRTIELPTARRFGLTGTARLSPRAADALLDELLAGTPGGATATSSSRLAPPVARASAAIDGDPATAWTPAYGPQEGQWIEVADASPHALDHLALTVVADGRHSVPTQVTIDLDGQRVATIPVPPIADQPTPGATTTVALPLPAPLPARRVRVTVDAVRPIATRDWSTRRVRTLPVGIAELGAPGFERAAPEGAFTTECRADLLEVDGQTVPVEVRGTVDDAVAGNPLSLTACAAAPLAVDAGDHDLRSGIGATTGIDIDRVVLRSAAGGGADDAAGPLRSTPPDSGRPLPAVEVLEQRADSMTVRVSGAEPGAPFWLTLGQGWNTGWTATITGSALGQPHLVDGFANGWVVEPTDASFDVVLRFAPQQRVTVALWASLAAALGCLVLAVRRPRRAAAPAVAAAPAAADATPVAFSDVTATAADAAAPPLGRPATVLVALALGALGVVLVSPAVGVLVGVLTAVVATGALPRWLTALVAPGAMALSGGYVVLTVVRHHVGPGLEWPFELHRAHPVAWFAVLALAVDAVVMALRGRRRR